MSTSWQKFLISQGAHYHDNFIDFFSDKKSELKAARNGNIIADLCHLDRITVSGKDAEDFLLGQLSNDIRLLNDKTSQLSTYCNPKGRMYALFRIYKDPQGFVMVADYNTGLPLLPRLKMFVMRAKVEILELDNKQLLMGAAGDKAKSLLEDHFQISMPANTDEMLSVNAVAIINIGGKWPRYLIAGNQEDIQAVWLHLQGDCEAVGRTAWEWQDIMSGLPSIHSQTAEQYIPQMLNLDVLHAINFQKGCYPGQEIIARMKYLGKLKQRMVLAHIETMDLPAPGDSVYAAGFGDQAAGTIVNAQYSPDDGIDALAVVQLKLMATDTFHLSALNGPELSLMSLPYDIPVEGETVN